MRICQNSGDCMFFTPKFIVIFEMVFLINYWVFSSLLFDKRQFYQLCELHGKIGKFWNPKFCKTQLQISHTRAKWQFSQIKWIELVTLSVITNPVWEIRFWCKMTRIVLEVILKHKSNLRLSKTLVNEFSKSFPSFCWSLYRLWVCWHSHFWSHS